MPLTDKQRTHLRSLAHKLKPVVWVGQHGLKPTVLEEINGALTYHELMKLKVNVGDREARDALIVEVCQQTGAELVQRIGNIAILYKKNPDKPGIELPRG